MNEVEELGFPQLASSGRTDKQELLALERELSYCGRTWVVFAI